MIVCRNECVGMRMDDTQESGMFSKKDRRAIYTASILTFLTMLIAANLYTAWKTELSETVRLEQELRQCQTKLGKTI